MALRRRSRPAPHPVTSPPTAGPPVTRAVVVAATAFVVIVCAGVFVGLPNLLVGPLHEELGWSYGTISVAIAVNTVLYGLTAPFAAAATDRLGVRRVAVAALLLVAGGAVTTTAVTAPWQLVLAWGVLVGLGCGAIATAFGALVAERWFTRHRGLVTGLLTSGTMFGGMVLLPVLAGLTTTAGWRAATWVVAGVAGAVALAAAGLLRDRPGADRPDRRASVGAPSAAASAPRAADPAPGAVRRSLAALARLARTGPFWLVVVTFAVCGASTNGVMMSHFVPAAADVGLGPALASTLLAVMGAVNVAGTVAAGWGTDRVDPRLLLTGTYALRAVSLAALPVLLGPDLTPALVVFAVSFGLLDLATVPPTVALCREYFGLDGAVVFAWLTGAHQVGAAGAALGAGVVRDLTGSYAPAFVAVAVLCALAAAASALIRRQPMAPAASSSASAAAIIR
ncbi:MFS transporter [Isoptericola sp. AK164]|uniref:MFS transporter n=1 Tax=Isoptericola sp. AK164 TaxID=3024246 RepID=UPI002418882E|nr:MFS transporter [Isoptericola sp. AK164]